jgi:hypothetical protein
VLSYAARCFGCRTAAQVAIAKRPAGISNDSAALAVQTKAANDELKIKAVYDDMYASVRDNKR